MFCKAKSATTKNFFLRGDFRPLPNKNVQIWYHFFPLLFPKDSESLKILDIQLQEGGGKNTFKRYLKSEHTNRRTPRRKRRRTFRLIESIGPEGRCFENGTILDHIRPYDTILDHFGQILTILDKVWTILDNCGPFCPRQELKESPCSGLYLLVKLKKKLFPFA